MSNLPVNDPYIKSLLRAFLYHAVRQDFEGETCRYCRANHSEINGRVWHSHDCPVEVAIRYLDNKPVTRTVKCPTPFDYLYPEYMVFYLQ